MYGQPYYGGPPNWPPQPPPWGSANNVVWVPAPPGTDIEKTIKLLDKLERRRIRKEEEAKKKHKEEPKKLKDVRFNILETISLVVIGYIILAPTLKGLQVLLP